MSATEISYMENLREAVRDNPLAAALIGGGALWLLLDNERLKNAASSVSAATAPLPDIGSNLRSNAPKFTNSPLTAPEMDHPASQHLGAKPYTRPRAPLRTLQQALQTRSRTVSTKGSLTRARVSAR